MGNMEFVDKNHEDFSGNAKYDCMGLAWVGINPFGQQWTRPIWSS